MDKNVVRLLTFFALALVWGVCVFFLAESHYAAGWWVVTVIALIATLAALVNVVESRRRGR